MRRALAALLLSTAVGPAASPTPLTEIAPVDVELQAFAATVDGALRKLELSTAAPVVHIVGASGVEDAVDWSAVCAKHPGARLVLVGPQAVRENDLKVARYEETTDSCTVDVVSGMYSEALMLAELGSDHPATLPDMIMLHNADIYMPYWRRTLAELLRVAVPVVLTVYCEFEVQPPDQPRCRSPPGFARLMVLDCSIPVDDACQCT